MLDCYKKLCTLFYDTDKPVPPPRELLFQNDPLPDVLVIEAKK